MTRIFVHDDECEMSRVDASFTCTCGAKGVDPDVEWLRHEIDNLYHQREINGVSYGRREALLKRANAVIDGLVAQRKTQKALAKFGRNQALEAAAEIVRRYVESNDAAEVAGAIDDILSLRAAPQEGGERAN